MTAFIEHLQTSSFYEFAALFTIAALAGMIANKLRQPLIIAFILIGIVCGPSVTGLVTSAEEITLLSKIGITVLLFIVGLKLDLKLVSTMGATAIIIGLGQIILTFGLSLSLCLALGVPIQQALFIAIALTLSSTIIIVKILSDKREIDSLHGRIALGILIVQDLAIVLVMMVVATIGGSTGAESSLTAALIKVTGYAILLLIFIGLFMRFAALKMVNSMAQNSELLVTFALAWAVLLAAICDMLGLSKELGGLLAGIALASTPYRESIIARLTSLRDFLLLFFFVTLGLQIDLSILGAQIGLAIFLSLFVLLIKPVIIMTLVAVLGYRKRTSFLTGLSLAQISEFSLIFISMAAALGMVTQETLGLVTLVGMVTIALSTYALSLSHEIYDYFEPYIKIYERTSAEKELAHNTTKTDKHYDIILFGLGRYGTAMAEGFLQGGKKILVADFNPEVVKQWRAKGFDAVYGDATDPNFYHSLPLKKTNWVISALPQHNFGITHEDPRLVMLNALKEQGFTGKKALAVHNSNNVQKFVDAGADVVFLPFHDAADRAVNIIDDLEKGSQNA